VGRRISIAQPPRRSSILSWSPCAERRPSHTADAVPRYAEVSPDDKWVAFESNVSGRDEIRVRPFPDVSGGLGWQVTMGGTQAVWARSRPSDQVARSQRRVCRRAAAVRSTPRRDPEIGRSDSAPRRIRAGTSTNASGANIQLRRILARSIDLGSRAGSASCRAGAGWRSRSLVPRRRRPRSCSLSSPREQSARRA